jgi:hypothetical protein
MENLYSTPKYQKRNTDLMIKKEFLQSLLAKKYIRVKMRPSKILAVDENMR